MYIYIGRKAKIQQVAACAKLAIEGEKRATNMSCYGIETLYTDNIRQKKMHAYTLCMK